MKKLCIILLAVMFAVSAVCAYKIHVIAKENRDNKKAFSEIEQMLGVDENPYKELAENNPDFVGWISIEGTQINYPVMQSKDNPDYYLNHSFEKEYSRFGVPYLDSDCVIGQSNNLIVYGHHMKDGSMFADLVKYSDPEFWLEHQYIEFNTIDAKGRYEVVAAFAYDTNNEEFNYTYFTYMNEIEFDEYVCETERRSAYDTEVNAEYGDELLTLSTCEYTHVNGRFVVVAKRVE